MEEWALTKGEEMGLWKAGEMDLGQFKQWIQATEKELFPKKKRPTKMRKVSPEEQEQDQDEVKQEQEQEQVQVQGKQEQVQEKKKKKGVKVSAATATAATTTIGKQVEVVAEEIQGIVYYIDAYENVYKPEDILRGVPNPTVLGKYVKVGNTYIVPDLGLY
jgi:hypothetical protein